MARCIGLALLLVVAAVALAVASASMSSWIEGPGSASYGPFRQCSSGGFCNATDTGDYSGRDHRMILLARAGIVLGILLGTAAAVLVVVAGCCFRPVSTVFRVLTSLCLVLGSLFIVAALAAMARFAPGDIDLGTAYILAIVAASVMFVASYFVCIF